MNGIPVIKVQLVHIQGPLKGQIQEFTQATITIGRHPSCSVQFPTETATISRRHAEIVRVDNRYKVVDQSTNGTYVNGKRVTEAFLKDGDVLMFTEGGPKMSYLASITDEIMAPEQQAAQPPAPVVKPAPPADPVPEVKPAPTAAPVLEQKPAVVAEPRPVPPEPSPRPAPQAPPARQPEATVRPPEPQRQAVAKVAAPLIVQYGPKLHSYKELPITIGKRPDCDFVLAHPSMADQHAQIFFSQGQYWIRDLTGNGSIAVNGNAIGFEAPLKAQDIITLAPQGPAFSFLGEGRLAEHEEEPAEDTPASGAAPQPAPEAKKGRSFLKDLFKK